MAQRIYDGVTDSIQPQRVAVDDDLRGIRCLRIRHRQVEHGAARQAGRRGVEKHAELKLGADPLALLHFLMKLLTHAWISQHATESLEHRIQLDRLVGASLKSLARR